MGKKRDDREEGKKKKKKKKETQGSGGVFIFCIVEVLSVCDRYAAYHYRLPPFWDSHMRAKKRPSASFFFFCFFFAGFLRLAVGWVLCLALKGGWRGEFGVASVAGKRASAGTLRAEEKFPPL